MIRSDGPGERADKSGALISGELREVAFIGASSPLAPSYTIHRYNFATMVIDVYWSRGSPFCWRMLLALEVKGLDYRSHQLNTDLQAHKAPQMLAMNPRGRLPVLRDGDYVVFESLAVLYYLDLKYP